MRDSSETPQTFEQFWPYYLDQHRNEATRQLHIAGTGVALVSLAAYAVTKRPGFLATALLGSYGPAWLAHGAIERNRPATFTYPIWSLLADLKMFALWTRGELDDEVRTQQALASQDRPSGKRGPIP